jgi:hypothetical protein
MLHAMETDGAVNILEEEHTLPRVEGEQEGLKEESTTTYDIKEQARGKKRRRNIKDKVYNWKRRLCNRVCQFQPKKKFNNH